MISPQIIHEEPCRGAMELKGKGGGGVHQGVDRSLSGARAGGEEVKERDPSDKCVWNRKEIPYYLQH